MASNTLAILLGGVNRSKNAAAKSGSEGKGECTGEGVSAAVVNSLLQCFISILDEWIVGCGCQFQQGCRVWASHSPVSRWNRSRIVGVTLCGVSWGTPRGSLPSRSRGDWRGQSQLQSLCVGGTCNSSSWGQNSKWTDRQTPCATLGCGYFTDKHLFLSSWPFHQLCSSVSLPVSSTAVNWCHLIPSWSSGHSQLCLLLAQLPSHTFPP